MSKELQHKNYFLLLEFIASKRHYDFDLNPYDLAILMIICRYLDMPLNRCFAKQTTLAKECLMSERQFRRSCEKLIKHDLIIRTCRGSLYNYYLGEALTNP